MATAGDGSQAPTYSGYGGSDGGVGGKFDRRSIRRNRSTPYDRPPTASRNPSWVSKLLVDPAKKLIASSANAFFSSVFRKGLPPPLPPAPGLLVTESNPESSDRIQAPVQHDEDPLACADAHNSRGKDTTGVLELEELLKQKSFTRSEIDHLTELLRSKAVDLPAGQDVNRPETSLLNPVTDIQKHRESLLAGKALNIERSQGLESTPRISSRVLDEDIASPTELAKAYMERLPSKLSPSTSSWRNHSTRNDGVLLRNSPFTPTSSVRLLEPKTAGHFEAGKNGFTTPSSRGRSAIYSMARTPYSRVNPSTFGKAGGTSGSMFRSPTLSIQDGNLGSKKRGISVLDDLGSGGPMRRTRQRNGPMSDKFSVSFRGIDVSKEAQKPSSLLQDRSFINDWNDARSKKQGDKVLNAPSTISHVHPRCNEVAAKILQHLENISPKEKSAESKLNASGERSLSSKMTSDLFSRPTPNNHQNAESSKMPWGQDHQKLDSSSNRESGSVQEGISGLKENVEQNGSPKSYFQREMRNGDAEISAKRVFTGTGTSGPATMSAAKHSPKFNGHEGSPGLAGDACRNGLASEGRGELQTSAASQQLESAKSTKDKNPVMAEKTSNLRFFVSPSSALPSSPMKLDSVKPSPSIPASEKPMEVGESSTLAAEAPDKKASFSEHPKSQSSFSFRDGFALTPRSKHGDSTTHEEAKSIENTQPATPFSNFTFGSSTSSSTPAFSSFDNSKLKNNGTDSISLSPFSSSPSISTSSASTYSSATQSSLLSGTAVKFASEARASVVTENKVQKKEISISPAGADSIFGSGTTKGFIFNSQSTLKESSFGVQSSGSGPGSTTVSQGTNPFQFGSSSSSPIFAKSGIAPFSFDAAPVNAPSSASNLFTVGQTSGFSSTTSSSESKPVVSTTGSGNSSTFAFATTMPAPSSGAVGFSAPSTFGFSSGSLTTASVSSIVSSTSGVKSQAFVPGTANPSPVFSWANPNLSSSSSGFTSGSVSAPASSFTAATPNFGAPSPMFGNQASSTVQTNDADDSMVEETLQQPSHPTLPAFGQSLPAAAASQSGFTFTSSVQSTPSLFQFSGQPSQSDAQKSPFQFSSVQPNQGGLQNPPFQPTGSLEFTPGGGGGSSFVFGSGGEKSGRKIVKVNRSKHRRK